MPDSGAEVLIMALDLSFMAAKYDYLGVECKTRCQYFFAAYAPRRRNGEPLFGWDALDDLFEHEGKLHSTCRICGNPMRVYYVPKEDLEPENEIDEQFNQLFSEMSESVDEIVRVINKANFKVMWEQCTWAEPPKRRCPVCKVEHRPPSCGYSEDDANKIFYRR